MAWRAKHQQIGLEGDQVVLDFPTIGAAGEAKTIL
jgi:hypothetical protein